MAGRFFGRTPAQLLASAGTLWTLALVSLVVTPGVSAQNAAAPANTPPAADGKEGLKGKVKVSDQMLVDLHVKDQNITDVLELLSIQSQKNIIASKSVSGKISADLYNVTFYEALDSILHVNGFVFSEKGNFIYVYTAEEFDKIQKATKQRTAKIIRLNYLNANDAAEFVKPMLSQNGGEIKTSSKTDEFKISDNVPGGKDDFALGATLVVIDYEENIKAVEKLLAELDTKPAQVLVEATVMQTKLDEANAFGIDFSIIGDVNFTDFATVGGPLGVADALRTGTGAGAGGGFSPGNNNGFGVASTPGKTGGKSTLKLGVISKNLALVMKLLDEVSDTTVMANPKLLVLNRQPARVQVIDRLAYISTTQTETSQTQTVQFLDTGVQLYFRPFVSTSGEIRMELKPQVSTGSTKDIKGTGGAAVTVPDESRQEITTNVIVQDGMTIVLGGLFRETTVATRSQVPLFGDIPVLGTPFRGHDDSVKREEIIFLVTPTIVNDKVLLSQSERAVDVIDRVRAGTRQGLLPWSRDKMTSALNVEADAAARQGDYEKAMWKLARSLTLNPRQPDALRLRERLVGEKEVWPARRMLDDVVNEESYRKLMDIQPAPKPVKEHWMEGQMKLPKQPANFPPAMPASPKRIPAAMGTEPQQPEQIQPAPAQNASADQAAAATNTSNPHDNWQPVSKTRETNSPTVQPSTSTNAAQQSPAPAQANAKAPVNQPQANQAPKGTTPAQPAQPAQQQQVTTKPDAPASPTATPTTTDPANTTTQSPTTLVTVPEGSN